jgi:hypothetical protein
MNAFISIMLVVRVKKVLPSKLSMISTRNAQKAFYPQILQRFQHAMKMLSIGFFTSKIAKDFNMV